MLEHGEGEPSEADLRRALSTAYYSLFHFICRECADRLVGCTDAQREKPAWRQAYRAMQHKIARDRCKKVQGNNSLNFPDDIRDFATLFVSMQELRERADYDMRPQPQYAKLNVSSYIEEAKAMIEKTTNVASKHRKALVVYLVMPIRDTEGH